MWRQSGIRGFAVTWCADLEGLWENLAFRSGSWGGLTVMGVCVCVGGGGSWLWPGCCAAGCVPGCRPGRC